MGTIEIFKDISDQYRFRILANNHKIIAVSEAYTRKSNAKNGVAAVYHVCLNKKTKIKYIDC